MKEKISAYFMQVQHLVDPIVQAQIMLDLFIAEHGKKCNSISHDHKAEDLDEALNRFYESKECRYVQSLLEQYVENGTFELPVAKQDTVQRLDRFKMLKSLLTELFPVRVEVKLTENKIR